ncbi:hypothetical protein CSKR_108466 [Clonorchis sinensis]|uniref:Uncharacterized protein n=1 Tax=Clonorchis sinensis TaxID=79923 RepID=A0A419PIC6_CLOSI|nr:hypothetical protein CSKR_108466 [Clonorchis sinensis]
MGLLSEGGLGPPGVQLWEQSAEEIALLVGWPKWLELQFIDQKVRGSNPTSASRLPLSRLGQPGSIPALVQASSGMAVGNERVLQPNNFEIFTPENQFTGSTPNHIGGHCVDTTGPKNSDHTLAGQFLASPSQSHDTGQAEKWFFIISVFY